MNAPGFNGMCKDISFTNHRNIRNQNIPEERFNELYQSIKRYIDGELEIPKQFNHEKQLSSEEIKIRYPFRYQVAELMSSPMAAASSQSETFIVWWMGTQFGYPV